MEALAGGDTQAKIPHQERSDEIGTMARALNVFRVKTEQIRELEAMEKTATAERAARAEAMVAVVNDVGVVVAAAAAGDFSARLELASADGEMAKLVAGINEINAVVDRATTEFAEALGRVAGGDLTTSIETAYRRRWARSRRRRSTSAAPRARSRPGPTTCRAARRIRHRPSRRRRRLPRNSRPR
jgi:methyl-accepting chemotaxis protein